MPTIVHEKAGFFHLCNDQISYIMMVLPDGEIGQIYFGERLHDRESFSWLLELAHRDMAPCVFDEEAGDGRVCWGSTTYSREHIRQEYPTFGTGDMRQPALEIEREGGNTLSHFCYKGYLVQEGKPRIPSLPATYVEQPDEAQTLILKLEDPLDGTKLDLYYSIYRDMPVITRHVRIRNQSGKSMVVKRAMSLNLDLPDSQYDMIDLAGASLRERYVDRHPLHLGIQSIGSMRGHSSHQFNPFLALTRPNTDEQNGEAIGISLVYSGNFLAQVEVDTMGVSRVMIGIHPQGFSWAFGMGEEDSVFCTPEAVLTYSHHGLDGMSRTFHQLFRTRLARGYWRDRERPIIVNNWEATYMNFDEKKVLEIAEQAKNLGVEMFVLDDGWFGHRDDATSSLGDWYSDIRKLPDGIQGLSEKIEARGMKFGLWIEPEMVSPDSDLFRAHPEWVLGAENRPLCLGRHQLVLDLSKPVVVNYLFETLEKLIESSRISYIKWDMNRSISQAWSRGQGAVSQGKVLHRQILGIYELYERLTTRFPLILFESCASGGGRFDPGMLYYAPQAWTSDDTDAAERVKIQYGTSLVYPLSCISNHVSAVPNHQTHRITSMFTRGTVAAFGAFGYELDITQLKIEEKEQMKAQVAFIKRWRGFIQKGCMHRLVSPFEGNDAAWMVVSANQKQALVFAFRFQQPVNAGFRRMRLQGLDTDTRYIVKEANQTDWSWKAMEKEPGFHYGDELMKIGLLLSDAASGVLSSTVPQGDWQARVFLVEES